MADGAQRPLVEAPTGPISPDRYRSYHRRQPMRAVAETCIVQKPCISLPPSALDLLDIASDVIPRAEGAGISPMSCKSGRTWVSIVGLSVDE